MHSALLVQKPTLGVELKQRGELVGLKVLIVDDEPDTCEMLRYVFNECGAIVERPKRRAGLELYDKWHPHILVSDIGMPDVDGYEFISIVREERRSKIPAVA